MTMGCLTVCLLIAFCFGVKASRHHHISTELPISNKQETGATARPPAEHEDPNYFNNNNHNLEVDYSQNSVINLNNIMSALDDKTVVELRNMELLVPNELNLGVIDPDFSSMLLNVSSVMGTVKVRGDYKIFTRNQYEVPVSSHGHVYINYTNITVTGRTALALTPAALMALGFDFVYTPQVSTVQLVPDFQNFVTEEVRASKDIMDGTIATMMNKDIGSHLDYYVDTHINFILSKMSVFTVGHAKAKALGTEPETQNVQIGDLFDELLEEVRHEIVERKADKIKIPNFHRNFSENLESTTIHGTFFAVDGWISGISHVKRTSNVTLSKHDNVFVLNAMVEFDDLEMGYGIYVTKFLKSEVKGMLDGNFLFRLFTVKIAMDPQEDGTCTSVLKELRPYKMNGYRIKHITNIGALDWLQLRINNWLVGYFQSRLLKDIEKELTTAIRASLSRFDCGEYLPHFKIVS